MVQEDDPLKVNSDSELDEEVEMSYDDLTLFCQKLLKNLNDIWERNNSLEKKIIFKENKNISISKVK